MWWHVVVRWLWKVVYHLQWVGPPWTGFVGLVYNYLLMSKSTIIGYYQEYIIKEKRVSNFAIANAECIRKVTWHPVRYTWSTLNKLSVNISVYYSTPGYRVSLLRPWIVWEGLCASQTPLIRRHNATLVWPGLPSSEVEAPVSMIARRTVNWTRAVLRVMSTTQSYLT